MELLALVDIDCNFIYADIGCQDTIGDGGVLKNSLLWQKMCDNSLNFPEPRPLPGSEINMPFVFLGDGAFALTNNLMNPYPGHYDPESPEDIFNSNLFRARAVVENAFGILVSKFRIFKKPMQQAPEKVSTITKTCILLHNFLRRSKNSTGIYTPSGTMDTYDENGELIILGSWREESNRLSAFRDLERIPRRSPLEAGQIRDNFAKYFCNQ